MVQNYILIYVRNWLRILGKWNVVIFNIASIHLPDKEILTKLKINKVLLALSTKTLTKSGCQICQVGNQVRLLLSWTAGSRVISHHQFFQYIFYVSTWFDVRGRILVSTKPTCYSMVQDTLNVNGEIRWGISPLHMVRWQKLDRSSIAHTKV